MTTVASASSFDSDSMGPPLQQMDLDDSDLDTTHDDIIEFDDDDGPMGGGYDSGSTPGTPLQERSTSQSPPLARNGKNKLQRQRSMSADMSEEMLALQQKYGKGFDFGDGYEYDDDDEADLDVEVADDSRVRKGKGKDRSKGKGKARGKGKGKEVAKPRPNKGEEAVSVFCRFRPESGKEIKEGGINCITFDDENPRVVSLDHDKSSGSRHYTFEYTHVFPSSSTQEQVYAMAGRPLIESVMNGFNAAIMAYGQTGSGKTFTMQGYGFDDHRKVDRGLMDASLQGVVPRLLREMFETIRYADPEKYHYEVRVSYIEIYMEKLRDLINTDIKRKLIIRQNSKRGTYITDATEVRVGNVDEVLRVMKVGLMNRTVAATKSNFDSSRSHAIFLISVNKHELGTKVTKTSQMYLVDLAGSEKVSKTEAVGQRLKEAQNINTSLLALSQVIYGLAEVSMGKKRHIQYRDSKLTRILKNSLGGNARTVLIICCSPSTYNAEETLSTLRFGERCQLIKNKVQQNQHRTVAELEKLLKESEREITRQQAYIDTLESELRRFAGMMSSLGVPKRKLIVSDTFDEEIGTISTSHLLEDNSTGKELSLGGAASGYSGSNRAIGSSSGSSSSGSSGGSSSSSSGSGSDSDDGHVAGRSKRFNHLEGESLMDMIARRRKKQAVPLDVTSFLCPLSKQIMTDPVFCSDGYTYERKAILRWLKSKSVSPMTGQKMRHTVVIPNMNLKKQIRNGFPTMQPGDATDFFQLIPIEIIVRIFSFLPGWKLGNIRSVCMEWDELLEEELIWAHRTEFEFGLEEPHEGQTWQDTYRKLYKKKTKEEGANKPKRVTVGTLKLVAN